jgi:hypothetical protein
MYPPLPPNTGATRSVPVSLDLITSRDIIPVDLASTEHLSSPDVVLELIFRHLLVDLPFFVYLSCR